MKSATLSILNQSYPYFEFLIMDDGSTDGSYEILKDITRNDIRIKLYTRENKGLPCTLNELISKSRGKYIARMDADDFSEINRLAIEVLYMELHKDVSVVGTSIAIMNSNKIQFWERFPSDDVRAIRMMFRNVGVAHPTALIRNDFLKKHEIHYDEDNVGSEDYLLWSSIAVNGGKIRTIYHPLLRYRVHENQITIAHAAEVESTQIQAKSMIAALYGISEEKDLTVIDNIYSIDRTIDENDIYRVFSKIIEGNRKKGIVDPNVLVNELAYQWTYILAIRAKHNKDYSMLGTHFLDVVKPGAYRYIVRQFMSSRRAKNGATKKGK